MSDRPSPPRATRSPRAAGDEHDSNPRSRAREPHAVMPGPAPITPWCHVASTRLEADQPATTATSRDGPGLTALDLGFSAECAKSKEITTRI
jgi:hypothetical protein